MIGWMAETDLWSSWTNLATLWWTRRGGVAPEDLARRRLELLVAYARERSPFYRERYSPLPRGEAALAALPVVTKAELMSRFDDWVTDPRAHLADVKRFLADRAHIGRRFLDLYWAWKSSGTSGLQGIFVQDLHAMAVYDALVATKLEELPWNAEVAGRIFAGRAKAALVVATGDHFASICSWRRMCRAFPRMDARSFSILSPLPRLVADLNEYRPAFIAGYPSILSILAREREAGRLDISPAIVWSGGEHLAAGTRAQIQAAFGCQVVNEYGASECLSIAHECRAGWLHLHAEWVLLEPIEKDGSATPPGRLSHSALLTNLANWLQPVIRYDLGDRIVASPRPCACGSRMPAFRVDGREEATLRIRSAKGTTVRLPPMALATVVEEAVGDQAFQIAQVAPATLALRFDAGPGRRLAAARRHAAEALRAYLAAQSLPEVELVHDRAPPQRERSGKLRAVVVDRDQRAPRRGG